MKPSLCWMMVGRLAIALAQTDLRAAECSYGLNPTSINHGPQQASGSFTLVTVSGCQWTAQASENWIHTTTSSHSSGSVLYTIDANPNPSPRTGMIFVADQTFTIKQSGNGCFATFSPSRQDVQFGAQTSSFSVQTLPECQWFATTDFGWIHTSSSGTGPGTVQFSIDHFAGPGTRVGTIRVLEQTFTISQLGESEKPGITAIADQKLEPGIPSAPIPFRVTGAFSDLNSLTFVLTSSNVQALPNDSILLGGSGADRILLFAPPIGVAGISRVTVSVTDRSGTTASISFTVTVGTPPPASFDLAGVRRDANGRFKCLITGTPGVAVVIQGSADLRTWINISTLENPTGIVDFTDTFGSAEQWRFYRIK